MNNPVPELIVLKWLKLRVACTGACSVCNAVLDVSNHPEESRTDELYRRFVYHIQQAHPEVVLRANAPAAHDDGVS
ncbi:MAG TPA: hypothetical protein VHN74_11695 [Candidatus Angelobacter sp.]|jgi:hypothetical protein|nr:hypothetical protein [Candidatus Angelobacter sp.]